MLTFPEYENVVYHESSDWDIIMHNNYSKIKLSNISVYYPKPFHTKERAMESFVGGHIALIYGHRTKSQLQFTCTDFKVIY